MKLLTVFLLAGALQVSARGYSQKISISGKGLTLQNVFKSIERQTDYVFFFDQDGLQKANEISLDMKRASLAEVLAACFKDQPLTYSIVGKTVVINEKEKSAEKKIIEEPAPPIEIKGKVTDASGNPLQGVSVVVKGVAGGTATDAEGNYQINVPDNSSKILVFSFVGMESQEVAVKGNGAISISLKAVVSEQQEVVLIGYGTTKRKNVTGAVTSVKMEKVNVANNSNFAQALAGRAAGVTAIQSSGQPGAGVSLTIRSNPSFASSGALYVVDGVVINDNSGEASSGTYYGSGGINRSPLNFINPNDIESIDILKDASATAIYGARAGGGVVLITTKRGKGGQPTVSYDFSHSFQKPIKFYEILSTNDYMEQRNKIQYEKWLFDKKIAPYGTTDPSTVEAPSKQNKYLVYDQADMDAQTVYPSAIDAITRNGSTDQHNLSLAGMSNKTRYFISGNYLDQIGVLAHSDFRKYSGRVNLEQGVGNKIRVGVNAVITGSKANNASIGTGQNEASSMVLSAFYYPPTLPFRDEAGNYPLNPNYVNSPNPLSFLEVTDYTKNLRMLVSTFAEWKIIDDLTARLAYSYDNSSSKRYSYFPKSFLFGSRVEGQAAITENNAASQTREYTLNYNKTISERHRFNILAGHSYQLSDWDGLNVGNDHFATDAFLFYNIGAGTAPRPTVGSYRSPTLVWKSYFARAIYELDGKYILTASIRRDGASNFAQDKKWGTFPGVSAAWILSEESFIKNISAINFLKLRAGYGTTGNSNIGSSAFAYYGYGGYYVLGTTQLGGVGLSQLANPGLTWETQKDINVGIDFGLYKNRISGSLDYFNRRISDLLSSTPLPTDFPVRSVADNAGTTKSVGWDANLQTRNIISKSGNGISWTTIFNASHYNDDWVERSPSALKTLAKYIDPKGPFNGLYGYQSDGIWNGQGTAPAWMPGIKPGGIIIKDLNGYDANGNLTGSPDGKISTADAVLLGRNGARYSFGVTNELAYRNFDLSVHMYGFIQKKYNSDYAEAFRTWAQLGQFGWNMLNVSKERWAYDNTDAVYPTGLQDNFATQVSSSDYWLENGNFLRCRDITLGYQVGNGILSKQNVIKKLRVYVNAQNPFIITKYRGMDPELQNYLVYPMTKSITVGLNAGF